jgi:ABC-type lipopolysaccharide export system ATPase subunit
MKITPIQLEYQPTSRVPRRSSWWIRLLKRAFAPRALMLDGRFQEISPRELAEIKQLLDQLREERRQ